VNAGRRLAWLVGSWLAFSGSSYGRPAAPQEWTPERVLAFVLRVERQMDKLSSEQFNAEHPELDGECRGYPVGPAIKKSVAVNRLRAFVTREAVDCFVGTYLGCDLGTWIARPVASEVGPDAKPFTGSKVTIVEQTADRVVADVTELAFESVFGGVGMWRISEDELRPMTATEAAQVKESSRYTITRGKDGVWRVADRKPSFEWVCKRK
jgi:hypothetical protein